MRTPSVVTILFAIGAVGVAACKRSEGSPCASAESDCASGLQCMDPDTPAAPDLKSWGDHRRTKSRCYTQAAADALCTANLECRGRGACTAREHKCTIVSRADCERSDPCRKEGACELKGGRCVVGSTADCAKSELCKTLGLCTLAPEREVCEPASDAECQNSSICKSDGQCRRTCGMRPAASQRTCWCER